MDQQTIKTIKISDHFYNKCTQFATEQIPTSSDEYKRRGSKSSEKIKQDITIGKMAEVAAYLYLKDFCTMKKPDFKIYEKKDKSFSADLICEGYHFHIKSQSVSQSKKYGMSWVFQRRDSLLTKTKPEDILVLCQVDDREVEIVCIAHMEEVKNRKAIGEPKLKHLRGNKCTIYYDDLVSKKVNLNVIS